MWTLFVVVALAYAGSAIAQSATGKGAAADADAIRAVAKDYETTTNAGDLERWIQTFTEDAVLLPPDHPMMAGRPAIRDFAKRSYFDPFKMQLSFSFSDLTVSGDWAFAHGPYTLSLTPKDGGPAVQAKGKFVDVFRRSPNGWKFARIIFNSDAPPPAR
jgi:uncharacterized protein (TIGR02246 family)